MRKPKAPEYRKDYRDQAARETGTILLWSAVVIGCVVLLIIVINTY